MRVMVMIEGSGADDDKIAPNQEMLEQMDAYNEALVKAGIRLDAQGLKPSKSGARVVFEGGSTSVVDGPFTESKEIVAGFWLWEVGSLEEAVEWAKRCPTDPKYGSRQVVEVRPLWELADFRTEDISEVAEQAKAGHGAS